METTISGNSEILMPILFRAVIRTPKKMKDVVNGNCRFTEVSGQAFRNSPKRLIRIMMKANQHNVLLNWLN
jgi:hypothetical protein